ncbi:MAG: NnrU family protein [Alphaproteobacteria bacterium]|nr:NnrU family protein [Alphaproteobacteria bacterium]
MGILIVGLVLFLGTHLLTTRRELRQSLIDRLGANGYRGLFSLAAMAGLATTIYGFGTYRAAGYVDVWDPPRALMHVAFLVNLPIFVLLIAAYQPGWIKTKTRHPMLLAVKLWALAHLLANGDLGSMLLFGGFLAWAGYARATMRHREAGAGASSPVDARFGTNDVIAIAAGFAIYGVFVKYLHPLLIGVALFGN